MGFDVQKGQFKIDRPFHFEKRISVDRYRRASPTYCLQFLKLFGFQIQHAQTRRCAAAKVLPPQHFSHVALPAHAEPRCRAVWLQQRERRLALQAKRRLLCDVLRPDLEGARLFHLFASAIVTFLQGSTVCGLAAEIVQLVHDMRPSTDDTASIVLQTTNVLRDCASACR